MRARAETIRVRGQVQGVGFRPFVWRLARTHGLAGEVSNDAEGVLIHAEGAALDAFAAALVTEAPPLARIDAVERAPAEPRGAEIFAIAATTGGPARTRVTPDAAVCAACRAEIADPAARRHRYPFANCTDCGPRFSIVEAVPYDRAATTMRGFAMCAACRAEYEDPADRRFHAQPIACPACGPRARLVAGDAEARIEAGGDPVEAAARLIREGAIVAVKALGGFHLACDATRETAVARLRLRKRRPGKPFALMAPDLATIRRYAAVSDDEAALLAGPAAPVVLLAADGTTIAPPIAPPIAPSVAPGQASLGWMLPMTPLHHLLATAVGRPMVMTSGNRAGEPQAIDDAEARATLGAIADAFLIHDRPIARRLDDSVARVVRHAPRVIRRARGYAPATLPLPPGFEAAPPVLAFGGQFKAALCLTREGQALLTHHLGDLDEPMTADAFARAEADYAALLDHEPAVVACDLHPGYRASLAAEARADALGVPLERVQHHHAHVASAMAEAGWGAGDGPVVGIVLDGLGLGPDGTVWGGEILLADYRGFERLAHLAPVALPGGDAAAREPWRNLLAHLDAAGLGEVADRWLAGRPRNALRAAVAKGLNAPLSSSAGRLFDAVAAGVGLAPERQSYEGEAAMLLEAAAVRADAEAGGETGAYPFAVAGAVISPAPMWRALVADLDAGAPAGVVAMRFHRGLAATLCTLACDLAAHRGARAVALSGGVFQNATLHGLCLDALDGMRVLDHAAVPANDGGLALGQAAVAAARQLD